MGRKKSPFYRIVVADSSVQRDGKVIEEIGYYYPTISSTDTQQLKEFEMDTAKYSAWVTKGAKPTKGVEIIAKKLGI
jgi:small subunit ribosomal protein S16